MIALPTRNGWLMLILSAAALASALLNAGLLPAIVAATLIGITLSGAVVAQFAARGVTVGRSGGDVAGTPGGVVLPLMLVNRAGRFKTMLTVTENLPFLAGDETKFTVAVPTLAPHESTVLRREVSLVRRGRWHLDKVVISGTDPCGLFRRSRRFTLPMEVVIRPEVFPIDAQADDGNAVFAASGEGRALGVAGNGGDFFGIRPYRLGDELRRVDWKRTAARGMMLVKEFEAADSRQSVIVLDTDRRSVGWDVVRSNFELLVSCAASLANWLDQCGSRPLVCAAFGKTGEVVKIGGDASGFRRDLEDLLIEVAPNTEKIERTLEEATASVSEGGTVFLLSMSASPRLAELVKALDGAGCRVCWFAASKRRLSKLDPEAKPVVLDRSSAPGEVISDALEEQNR